MKAGIFNPFTSIPKNEKSHVRGWAKVWAFHLDADVLTKNDCIHDYDVLYIDHGVNFEGSLNLFGGLNSEIYERLLDVQKFLKAGKRIISLDHDMRDIDYYSQIENRLSAKSTDKRLTAEFIKSLKPLYTAKSLTYSDLKYDSAIIGDSHSTAFAAERDMIFRTNGKTLYSISQNLAEYVRNFPLDHVENLTFCFGSIDIRFHAHRHKTDFEQLLISYCQQIISLPHNCSVCLPLPIESENRKIPKSGFYKGQPFYGSRMQRIEYLMLMKEIFEYFDLNVISAPTTWYTLEPEVFEKEYMEFGGSVHLSPKAYRMFSKEKWNV